MNPPTAAFPITIAPGSPITFSGTSADDEGLKNVEITLRNNTTRHTLASDGTWSVDNQSGWYRISPVNIAGASYNWSYTTPFNLVPGSYSFSVRATDELDLSTSSTNQGRLTINVQVAGDSPPNTTITPGGTQPPLQVLSLNLAGTATDDFGVAAVEVSIRDRDSSRYLQDNGTLAAAFNTRTVVLSPPTGLSVNWTLAVALPAQGDYDVTAIAYDTVGQQDTSTSGATSRYQAYPGDLPPVSTENLFTPSEGSTFNVPRITTTGRFEDDQQMAEVEVAIVNSLGQYMSSTGQFTSTTASWRGAFMNSPGSPGSNFSYTSPVIPNGTYTLMVRGVDQHDFATNPPVTRTVIVNSTVPNLPPVASFTYSCNQNVCAFDGRSSTDEDATTLVYSWNFGTNQGSGSGPIPSRTYNRPGAFTVTLTVRDGGNLTATATQTVTIVEPTTNVPPVAVLNPPACQLLVCNFSSAGTADPNVGDTVSVLWTFGDPGNTTTSTSTSPSRTFTAPGTYTVTLTATDGWGDTHVVTRAVTVTNV